MKNIRPLMMGKLSDSIAAVRARVCLKNRKFLVARSFYRPFMGFTNLVDVNVGMNHSGCLEIGGTLSYPKLIGRKMPQ